MLVRQHLRRQHIGSAWISQLCTHWLLEPCFVSLIPSSFVGAGCQAEQGGDD